MATGFPLGESPASAPSPPPPVPTSLPVDAPQQLSASIIVVLFAFTFVGAVLVMRLGVLRARSVVGPRRQPDQGGLWPLMVVAVVGFLAWQFGLGIYLGVRQQELKRAGVEDVANHIMTLLTPRDYAVMSTVPAAFGVAAMLLALRLLFPGILHWIGLSWDRLPRGAWYGFVAFVIIGPLVMWSEVLLTLVYHLLHYSHPSQHELLTKLGQAQSKVPAVLLVIGATLMAPLLEELLFRGLIQTFLREAFMRLTAPLRPPRFAVAPGLSGELPTGDAPPPALTPEGVETLPPRVDYFTPPPPPVPKAWHAWTAIVLTSIAFAMLHDPWMRPVIFVLSLGLGYVYERTGILWAPMMVHLLFNSVNTLQYVLTMTGH